MDSVIRLLSELVAINSINPTLVAGAPGEAEIAAAVAAAMRRFGLDVETQLAAPGRPNTIGVLEGRRQGRALMLCGHVDTVGVAGMASPFAPIERDGRLYGRGAQDMKSGVAAMIDAARVVAESGGLDAGRLIVAAVVDEEHSSIGADALVATWTADAAVVTEPTGLEIAVGHKGFAWIDVEVHGKAAHGSRPGYAPPISCFATVSTLEVSPHAIPLGSPCPVVVADLRQSRAARQFPAAAPSRAPAADWQDSRTRAKERAHPLPRALQ